MRLDMLLHVSFLRETLKAYLTSVRLDSFMHQSMVFKVPAFAERLIAPWILTNDQLLVILRVWNVVISELKSMK